MSFPRRARLINPRLGTYFGIFTSAFVGIALLSLIFEQLGTAPAALQALMLSGPLVLYAAIGIAAYAREPLDYFASGRRVPAFYSGLCLSVTALGATGITAAAGLFFSDGFDALFLVLGGLSGFVVLAIMLAPFLRKFGAFTIPSYLGRRFDSRFLRIVAAAILAVPVILMLGAELRMGAFAASLLTGLSTETAIALLSIVMLATVVAGGMRSLSWSSVAQAIAFFLALLVPVAIVGVMLTNLPIPQLSHGPVLRALGRNEVALGVPAIIPPAMAFDLAGDGLVFLSKRFADAYGAVGPLAFALATLTTMAGVAAAPWLLPRVAAAPGVYEARKSLGWATVLFGVAMITAASAAVFMRHYVVEIVTTPGPAVIPVWLKDLAAMTLAGVETLSTKFAVTSFGFKRDAVLWSLPIAAGMPRMVYYLALAGGIAAALAAAGAAMTTLGNMLAEDVVNGSTWEPGQGVARLAVARGCLAVAALAGASLAVAAPTDPLKLLLWALALTGSALFPVLVLSIWWKRINAYGALAGLVSGFSVAVLAILGGEAAVIGISSGLAGVFGIPAGTLATVVVTLLTPPPSRHALELVRDIRVPGGEILYDREMRLQKLKQRQRG